MPWCDPLAAGCGALGAALVSGNAVVLKPSEKAPLAVERLTELLDLGPVLQLLHGDERAARPLSTHAGVDLVMRPGEEAAGSHLAIVDAGTDPAWAAEQVAVSAFAGAGQSCGSVERVHVHRASAEAFLQALTTRARTLRIGPGMDPATEVGPLIDADHRLWVHRQVQDAVYTGAQLHAGGASLPGAGFFNNALGIAPNALDGEKYPPAEDNVITDNDIFWNNFNYHQGKPPFAPRDSGTAALAPVGTGILLFGGRGNVIENNRIYGNYLAGVAAVEAILVEKTPAARTLANNVVKGNQFGLSGTDVNGADIAYDGNGTNNCFLPAGVTSMFPADGSTFGGCGNQSNVFNKAAQDTMISWVGEGAMKAWNKHPHPPKPGFEPLEVFGS